jgi:ABC-type uncharacterized transport system permease subunit
VAKQARSPLTEALAAVAVPIGATLLGLLVGTIFILASGSNPAEAYAALWQSVAGDPSQFGETLVNAIPLILTGLAVALAFRCGLFNIGVEGQYLVALVASAWAGYRFALPHVLHITLALLAGAVAGAAWAAIAGLLKAYRDVNEVITTIMLNYIALYFAHWLVMAPLRDPQALAPATPPILPTAMLAQGLIAESRLHAGLWIALAAALLLWLFLWRTPLGYEIRAVGLSPGAAEYAGISVKRNVLLVMALSGALAGLAGGVQTLGITGRFYEQAGFIGYGFEAIAVALVGRNHPVGTVLSALLFAALDRGGPAMQAMAGVPMTVIAIVQGTVILFVAVEGLWNIRQKRKARAVKPA